MRFWLCCGIALSAGCGVQFESTGGAGPNQLQIRVLSNRADLISGGDALVEIVAPAGADVAEVAVDDDGRDVTGAFSLDSAARFRGLVTGLDDGPNVLTARLPDGRGARLTIVNHPKGGPVFSGAQVMPWRCTTTENGLGPPQDAQCNAPSTFTANSDGSTTERGTMNRGIYEVRMPASWNGKLLWQFGGGTSQKWDQGTPEVLNNAAALAAGYALAASTMTVNSQHSNDVTSAETVMMVKEHIVERYGEIVFTVGQGDSGGALQQYLIADAYPGLLNGLRPTNDWQDQWVGAAREFGDCAALYRYFQGNALWADTADQVAVFGHGGTGVCNTAQGRAPDYFSPNDYATTPPGAVPPAPCAGTDSYDPATNPEGVRCTLADFMVSIFGTREDGKARRAWDNVGVQYGLRALQEGAITAEQFADLNAGVGGYDIDFFWQPQRSAADPDSVEIAHRTGRVTYGRELAKAAILAIRGTNNNDYHYPFRTISNRARLDRANGHHDNHVFWIQPAGITTLEVMDQWLTAITADTSGDPIETKVRRNKPPDAVDACWIGGEKSTDMAACDQQYPYLRDTRVAAGESNASDILKCQLKPLDRGSPDYAGITFTDAQWAQLETAFPTGVCDWSKPGVGQEVPTPWITFDGGPGGAPLPPPPVSAPL
jgi:hypothetical protein